MRLNGCRIGYIWMAPVLLLFVLGLGCSSKEEKTAKHLQKARQYFEKSEFKRAVIEFKNVVQLDPQNDSAHYELGEAYMKLNQGNQAFQSFSSAVSINPDNLKAQLKMGNFFIIMGDGTEEAREKAKFVLEKSPDNIEGLHLLSRVLIKEKDVGSAIKTLEKAASIDPNHSWTHLALARLFASTGDLDQAEKAYLKTIAIDPSVSEPRTELSGIYATKGKWDKAESELKKMVETSNAPHKVLPLLALFYESRGNVDQAEKSYLEAVASAPSEEVEPLVILSKYYARQKSYDKALGAMHKAAAVSKDDLDVLANTAELHFVFNKIADAEMSVDKVLERDKGHVRANFLKGRLYLVKKDFANALERFELVVKEDPGNAGAHHFKALSLMAKGERNLAQQDLLKALELEPGLIDARLMLAESYLRDRDLQMARQQVDILLEQIPSHVGGLMLHGILRTLEEDVEGAKAVFRKVLELAPDYAPAYFRLGVLHAIKKQYGDALRSFERALELNPQTMRALDLMVGIYVQEKKYDKAFEVCEGHKQQVENFPVGLARIEYLKGSVFLAKGDTKRAEQRFQEAIDIQPNILDPYLALARIYKQEDRLSEAISQYEAVLSKQPNYLAGYHVLGIMYDQQGDGEKAEAYYRKALEIRSDSALAANNLAWNLAHKGGNIDEALGLAQTAKEHMPESSHVMDTLGWIYYLKGIYLNAIAEFQDSLERDPDNPVVNYHLGLAFYKNNQPDKALESLEKALDLAQDFEGAEEARSILKNIKGSGPSE